MDTPVIEEWTREEIVDALTEAVTARLGIGFAEFVKQAQQGELDSCEHAELIALLSLLLVHPSSIDM